MRYKRLINWQNIFIEFKKTKKEFVFKWNFSLNEMEYYFLFKFLFEFFLSLKLITFAHLKISIKISLYAKYIFYLT